MLHQRPDLVREKAFPIQESTVGELADGAGSFGSPWSGYTPRRAGGVTHTDSAEKRTPLVDCAADRIADLVVAFY